MHINIHLYSSCRACWHSVSSAGVGRYYNNEKFIRKHLDWTNLHTIIDLEHLFWYNQGRLSFIRLTHAHLHIRCKLQAEERSLRLSEFKVQFDFPKKMFMSSSESLRLAFFCFCVTGYGYLQCLTSFFYYRVEVPASSEPHGMNKFTGIGLFGRQAPNWFPESYEIALFVSPLKRFHYFSIHVKR